MFSSSLLSILYSGGISFDRKKACSSSDRRGWNFESCLWSAVTSETYHYVLLSHFSLCVCAQKWFITSFKHSILPAVSFVIQQNPFSGIWIMDASSPKISIHQTPDVIYQDSCPCTFTVSRTQRIPYFIT